MSDMLLSLTTVDPLVSQLMSYNITETMMTSELYDVPLTMIVFLSIAYGAVSLSAVIGNTIVLWYVVRSQRLRSVTNLFIANLATADILIGGLAIPFQFQAALLQRWVLPDFMCAFCPFVQILSVNVSIFTLTAIAADRYLVVVRPLQAKITEFRARIIVMVIWILAVLVAIPAALALRVKLVPDVRDHMYDGRLLMELLSAKAMFSDETLPGLAGMFNMTIDLSPESLQKMAANMTVPMKPFCSNIVLSQQTWRLYNMSLVVMQYFLPLVIVTFAYGRMGATLRGGAKTSHPRRARLSMGQLPPSPGQSSDQIETSSFVHRESLGQVTAHMGSRPTGDKKMSTASGVSRMYTLEPRAEHMQENDEQKAQYIATNKKKVIKMLFIVVALFAVCWAPLQIYNLLSDLYPEINE
ncbi:Tachykinin-like peptides receptor 99D [Halotydeus destructor]|nr:Tachykinin-like peptides receptor 99D [Halotydeus destructor]